MKRLQTTDTVLMVRPARFGFNEETAGNNYFQKKEEGEHVAIKALNEFDNYVQLLRANGVRVIIIQDTPEPYTPDSIFPNNWFSTHCTGELVFYPMLAENRQLERKHQAVNMLSLMPGVKKTINLTDWEKRGKFLEGTGSMILDRVHRVLFACRSPRTDEEVLAKFCQELNYEYILFDSVDSHGRPIYHTNVMMCIASRYVVICMDSIPDAVDRRVLRACFRSSGREIIEITQEQVDHFAGNMLAVHNENGESILLMSRAAYQSLRSDQLQKLETYSKILAPDLTTIEQNGGGSARCMVAELFLDVDNEVAEEGLSFIFE